MDEINEELGKEGGPFFLGWGYSMVDIVFAPFLERIAASIPYYKVRKHPVFALWISDRDPCIHCQQRMDRMDLQYLKVCW